MFALTGEAVGYAAGLATSGLWTITSIVFTEASRRLGATAVNAVRITLAVVFLALIHRLCLNAWVPQVEPLQVALLAASGLLGLAIGDQALFTAFLDVGPRISTLVMTSAPLLAACFGWLWLGETVDRQTALGIALTLGGIIWVVLERPTSASAFAGGRRGRGVLLAFVGAACQAGGLLLSKRGMGHGADLPRIDPLSATLVRMACAAVSMIPILLLHLGHERLRRAAGVRPARPGGRSAGLAFTTCGAIAGPTLGVWMSLLASDRLPLGVAQTLCSLPPVLILPLTHKFYGERVSPRAACGAVLAVTGIAVLTGLLRWR